MSKIGIENFRVFKEFTEFEIKPITLLTGTNNAGKSSFTKLLLLLKNGIKKLNFNEGLHNLESFDKVLNWESENKYLKIRYDNKLEFLDDSFSVDTIYFEGEMMAINISNGQDNLLTFSPSLNQVKGSPSYNLNFNIDLMMYLIYNDKTTSFSEIEDNRDDCWLDDEGEHEVKFYEEDLTLENFVEVFEENDGYFEDIGQIVLKHEIKKLERDYLLYDIFIKGEKATPYYKEKIIAEQKLEFSNIEATFYRSMNYSLENVLLYANEQVKYKIQKHFSEFLKEEDIEIKETRLGRLLLTEKLFDSINDFNSVAYRISENKATNYQKTFFQKFSNFSKGLAEDFNTIEYISANRGSQKRILNNKSENDIDQIVLDFFKKSDENAAYLEEIFNILEIPGKLTVERYENVISIVYLTINDKKIALSDVGFGYSQLIPIILKLATLTASDYGKIDNMNPEEELEFKRSSVNFRNKKL